MTKQEMEESRQKRLETLRASYEMYERSKEDTKEKHKKAKDKNGNKIYSDSSTKQTIQLMETMQQDIYDEYIQLGGNPDELKKNGTKKKGVDRKVLEEIMRKETMKDEMAEMVKKMNRKPEETDDEEVIENTEKTSEIEEYAAKSLDERETSVKKVNTQTATDGTGTKKQIYDLVKLPSKGEAYKGKESKLKVSYLTAYDENMILAPGLYEDGSFLEKLLEAKILDTFNVNDLLPGDRDAIVIWLRATGYGNEYPLVVTDKESGKEFKTTFDLSTIKYKEFNLVGDENGYFEYTLPVSGDVLKFKFLTIKDLKFIKDIRSKEETRVAIDELRKYVFKIDDILRDNDNIDKKIRDNVSKMTDTVFNEIVEKYDYEKDNTFSHILTDTLILHTISVNGIKDRKYISEYIQNMNIRDAAEYRRYINTNEPGVDYNIQVERPASLGGGSIDTFLQLSQFIFVNFE